MGGIDELLHLVAAAFRAFHALVLIVFAECFDLEKDRPTFFALILIGWHRHILRFGNY